MSFSFENGDMAMLRIFSEKNIYDIYKHASFIFLPLKHFPNSSNTFGSMTFDIEI